MRNVTSRKILRSKKFQELKKIGGHSVYHTEGNAFRHSILVWRASKKVFKGDSTMQLVALLHDIGKIKSSVREGKGNWKYPNHSIEGGRMLEEFLPKNDKRFGVIQWYISNHIKPLFWKSIQDAKRMNVPKGCKIQNLARLALCDIEGSKPIAEVDNTELINLLWEIARS